MNTTPVEARCGSCGRPLRRPSPDGYGPVCSRAMRPQARGPTPPPAASPPPASGQLALDLDPAPRPQPTHTQEQT